MRIPWDVQNSRNATGDLPAPSRSYEYATGTITTNVGVNFNGESNSTGLENDYTRNEIHSALWTEKANSSNYHSSHTTDENGLARDGQFSYTATSSERTTGPKSACPSRKPDPLN